MGSRTRSIYFVLTGVWGFLLGGAALAVGLSLSGLTPRITMPLVAVFAALLATTVISSLVLKNSYTETRRRQKR